ncbi:hypothetical protein N7532_006541 [Penicillium argentinense]|uniref:Uncharacterized protein n=1 Tax=Penicillium argentinense TaxID=1131581 RepID=A0A9W9KAY3_9EURO|nr:uncharacterized protein N7532_006541 [Penicillium argentinense]KAJ5099540.1 hypothetical protein N7532_006541 [Penicillium argentinense]
MQAIRWLILRTFVVFAISVVFDVRTGGVGRFKFGSWVFRHRFARRTRKSAWLPIACELPVMPLKMSYGQTITALHHAETSVEYLDLEANFLVPTLYTIGMQMARNPDRKRIFKFIETLKQKGFAVNDEFLTTIQRVWSPAEDAKEMRSTN